MWRALFGAGSALAAASGLAAVGLLLQGLPMIDPQRMSSRPADYASPFVLLVVAAGLASVLWHGLTYALAREPDQALLRLSRRLWPLAAALSLAAGVWWCISRPESLQRPLLWMGGLLFAGGLVAGRVLLVKGVWAFRSSCVSVIGIWVAAGAALYPNVLPAAGNPQWSVSIAQGAAPLSTLRLLALSGLALTPVILAYTLFVYRALGRRSRAKAPGQGGEA
jgi:cytochrome d ubiquinol oxidase subunit II